MGPRFPAEVEANGVEDEIEIFEDLSIFEADHLDPEVLKEKFPFVIVNFGGIVEMDLAVELDGKLFGRAVKIKDVAADAVLTAKLAVVELRVLHDPPERSLGRH